MMLLVNYWDFQYCMFVNEVASRRSHVGRSAAIVKKTIEDS